MKVVFVGIFVQSWDNFSVIYDIVMQVFDFVGVLIFVFIGLGDEVGVYESFDNMVVCIIVYGDMIGDCVGWVFGVVLGVIFFVFLVVFVVVIVGIIVFVCIVFVLMIVIVFFMIVILFFKLI